MLELCYLSKDLQAVKFGPVSLSNRSVCVDEVFLQFIGNYSPHSPQHRVTGSTNVKGHPGVMLYEEY